MPDVRAIVSQQDVGQTAQSMPIRCADVRLQCSASPIDHSPGSATVPGGPTAWCHATDRA
jgi:hypothetical protein